MVSSTKVMLSSSHGPVQRERPRAGSTMVRWGKCFAHPRASGQPRVEGGNVARQAGGENGWVGYYGDREITSGVLRLEYQFVASKDKDGHFMFIGLADASAPAQAGDCGRKVAWGYHPYDGEVWAFSDPLGAAGTEVRTCALPRGRRQHRGVAGGGRRARPLAAGRHAGARTAGRG